MNARSLKSSVGSGCEHNYRHRAEVGRKRAFGFWLRQHSRQYPFGNGLASETDMAAAFPVNKIVTTWRQIGSNASNGLWSQS
jgi:hypothetical protein